MPLNNPVPFFRGAQVKLTTDETISNQSATPIPWDAAVYDTDGFWSAGNPTRLTVPAGVSYVRLTAGGFWGSDTNGYRDVEIYQDGAVDFLGHARDERIPSAVATVGGFTVSTPVLSVTAGNYFEVYVYQNTGTDLAFKSNWRSFFAIEVVG